MRYANDGRRGGAARFAELLRDRRGTARRERRGARRRWRWRSRRRREWRRRSASRAWARTAEAASPATDLRKRLGNAMAHAGGGPSQIPAGFTYLGQFVDHDLTFDKTNVMLGAAVSPAALLQARSPSLDLDSLYGAGPQDPESAKFYEADGVHLKTGRTVAIGADRAMTGFDLPRGAGRSATARRKADDPRPAQRREPRRRADALRVHPLPQPRRRHAPEIGAAVAALRQSARDRHAPLPVDAAHGLAAAHCARARRRGRLQQRAQGVRGGVPPTDVPTMPIEFSVAAYRLGHSMVRARLQLERALPGAARSASSSRSRPPSGDLGGVQRLPSNWIADFRRLYDFGEAGRRDLGVRREDSTARCGSTR